MKKGNYAFSYTSFEYADCNGIGNKKKVNIPFELNYKKALKDTKILTISVMFDTNKIEKELIKMPNVKSEDIATWWKILKNGYTAYGLNEVLVYYRRTSNTLTSNKLKSAHNRWNLYRKEEGFSIIKSFYYSSHYAVNAIIKRI